MSCNSHQSYGIKCEPDTYTLPLLNAAELFQNSGYQEDSSTQERYSPHTSPAAGPSQQEQPQDMALEGVPVQDMDLTGFLEMDDKALTGVCVCVCQSQ